MDELNSKLNAAEEMTGALEGTSVNNLPYCFLRNRTFLNNYVVIGCSVILRLFVQRINKEKLIALNTDVMNSLTLTVKHIPIILLNRLASGTRHFKPYFSISIHTLLISSVQLLSRVQLFATP